MRQALVVLMLLFAAGAHADTLLTIKTRLEKTPPPEPPRESPGEGTSQLWVGDHRLREDTPKYSASVIRRFDRKKLYLINHESRTWSETDLPFGPPSGGKKRPPLTEEMTVTVTGEVRQIGRWNARKVIVVSRGLLGETTSVKWMSTEVGVDEGTLNQWQAGAIVLPPGSIAPEVLEAQRRLDAIPGYPVLTESRIAGGPDETEYRWHIELVSAEAKEPPADLYEPPAGYTRVSAAQSLDGAFKSNLP